MMIRRQLLGMVGALALAGLMGVRADAAEGSKVAGASCAWCGDACTCPAGTCDATAEAGKGCDCCGGAACCTSVEKAARPRAAVAR